MPRVLISDKLSPAAVAIFKERGVEVDVKPGLDKEELAKIIGDYDGLAIRSATKVTAKLLEQAKKLKVVGRAGIGVDNVDIPAATAHGVIVMNTPFGNSITTAEHAIALMFALARQIPTADASTQAGKWEKNRFMGVEITGKVLGIIGCGNIGSIVAERGIGLKMRVIAFDPFLSPERAAQIGVEKVELDDLLARADVITLHTPMTAQTKNILSAENIAKTKKGVRIINCARGGLVNETALRAALDSGQVGGAGFDVFTSEPAKENVLFGHANVVATPGSSLVLVDWAGAGIGPRAWALAFLMWAEAAKDPRRAALALAGYMRHVALEAEEIDRLAAMLRARPLIFDIWRLRHGAKTASAAAADALETRRLAEMLAARVRARIAQ